MATTVGNINGLLTTAGFRQVFTCKSTNRKPRSCPINCSLSSNDNYLQRSKELMKSDGGVPLGPPRWFSPLDCGCRLTGSPVLLFLPGIDGDGLGLMLHHKRLGEIFDIWCLHIPLADRTPLADLAMVVKSTIKSEHKRAPKRPIYLVGESFGASLALVVAAQNPHIDLVLILANPATSFGKSLVQSFVPLSDMIHKHLQAGLRRALNSTPERTAETILWKLNMIHEMQTYLDSHLHAVKAQTLVLKSGKDMLLSSITEDEKLQTTLQRCQIRLFIGNEDPLFLDDSFDLVLAIKCTSYYRRGASIDYISNFLPPCPSESKQIYEPFRWMDVAFYPVIFSTINNGKIVRGLTGIPSHGPVLLVGNHMMLGMDSFWLIPRLWTDTNIMVRTIGHPGIFERLKNGMLPDLSVFDVFRVHGAVPISTTCLYKLLSVKSHVLLFPGGARETLHRKGEEHKLFWPAEPEFVRTAARFGATIIPFGGVGDDDVLQLLLDFDDQMKIPPLKVLIEEMTSEAFRLRTDDEGEVGKQLMHYPVFIPKLPGRLYFLFGKPISTQGRDDILRNKDKAREMYLEVQNEIHKCIDYLKEKREKDSYRNLLARLAYQSYNGFHSQIPTFDI